MKKTITSEKAFTLTELTIAMALVAVVSLLVVSFSILANSYATRINSNRETIADLGHMEEAVSAFCSSIDDSYAAISSDQTSLIAERDGKTYTLSLNDDKTAISAFTPSGGTIYFEVSTIDSVSFSYFSNGTSGLVAVRVAYEVKSQNKVSHLRTITYYHAMRSGTVEQLGGQS